jgi:hypothetical protein
MTSVVAASNVSRGLPTTTNQPSSTSSSSTSMDASAKRAMNDLFLSWMSRPDTEAIITRALLQYQPHATPAVVVSSLSSGASTPHSYASSSSTSTNTNHIINDTSTSHHHVASSSPTSPTLIPINATMPSLPSLSLSSNESTSSNGSIGNGPLTSSPKSARARLLDLANVGITPSHSVDSSIDTPLTQTTASGRPKTPISVVITSAPDSPPSNDITSSNNGGGGGSGHHNRRGSSPLLGSNLVFGEPHSPDGLLSHNGDTGRPSTPLSPGNLTPRRAPSPSHRLDINRITASPPRSPCKYYYITCCFLRNTHASITSRISMCAL